jgi:hypothetical protein
MKLLGHESMVTSQRYVDGASAENRAAAARIPCTASSTVMHQNCETLRARRMYLMSGKVLHIRYHVVR